MFCKEKFAQALSCTSCGVTQRQLHMPTDRTQWYLNIHGSNKNEDMNAEQVLE